MHITKILSSARASLALNVRGVSSGGTLPPLRIVKPRPLSLEPSSMDIIIFFIGPSKVVDDVIVGPYASTPSINTNMFSSNLLSWFLAMVLLFLGRHLEECCSICARVFYRSNRVVYSHISNLFCEYGIERVRRKS